MADYDLGRYGATLELDDSQFTQAMQNAEGQMDNADKKAKGFGLSLGSLATGAIAGLSAALVGVGVAGVKMAGDLKSSLNNLQIQTGLTDEEMQGLDKSIKNIYNANLGENFEDIASAMANVQQNTGFVGQELENATKNALLLSEKFDMDVNESTRAVKAMVEQLGVSADEAFNLIVQGAQNGANKNGDLLDTFNEYSPAMKSLGFSAEQFTNILIVELKMERFQLIKLGMP
jgi:phage-related minor tail protein